MRDDSGNAGHSLISHFSFEKAYTMALTAVLEFGDNNIKRYSKQYLVSDCRFVFRRPYSNGLPEGAARCECIEVVVVAPGKSDLNLVEWFSSQGVQDGRIVISLSPDGNTNTDDNHVLYFSDARCFSLSEMYDIDSQSRRLLTLGILAESIQVDEVNYHSI